MTTPETPSLPWVLDRKPTEKDSAPDGTVVVPCTMQGLDRIHWSEVKSGFPWRPSTRPEQPKNQVRRVPRGFDSLYVSVNQHGNQTFAAVADDKTAWVKGPYHANWIQVQPLPDREEVE